MIVCWVVSLLGCFFISAFQSVLLFAAVLWYLFIITRLLSLEVTRPKVIGVFGFVIAFFFSIFYNFSTRLLVRYVNIFEQEPKSEMEIVSLARTFDMGQFFYF